MNPIPLTDSAGVVRAWACLRCGVAANAWPEDCGHEFAEQCGRCYSCGTPAEEPLVVPFAADRGCKMHMCRACGWRTAWTDTFTDIAEAIELDITNKQVWDAWQRDKRSDLR